MMNPLMYQTNIGNTVDQTFYLVKAMKQYIQHQTITFQWTNYQLQWMWIQLITWEDITWHRSASRDITQHKKPHYIKCNHITSHHMTWHLATNHITSPHVTSQPTTLLHLTLQPHQNRSPHHCMEWLKAHSLKNSVWASQWLVTLCTFYRQILSLAYSFFLLKLPPPACPALLVYNILHN